MIEQDDSTRALSLLRRMISVDSRSLVSNIPIADMMEAELQGFEIERVDYLDAAGVKKRNLVAVAQGQRPRVAFAGHLDTVSDTEWTRSPFEAVEEGDNLHGLGACDMKGPIAAFVTAIRSLPDHEKPLIVLTADEEIGKQGVRETVAQSALLKHAKPGCFVVAEPTRNGLVRGHRVDVQFTAHARGVQAHSSTGKGFNANITLIPFLVEMRALYFRLRDDTSYHDSQYDPPYCDLNFVIDNYGTYNNTTVGLASCRIKFRYCKSFDPTWVIDEIKAAAERHKLELIIKPEAPPPELPPNHPLVRCAETILGCRAEVAGLGTEASEYSRLAPAIICGPGDIQHAHQPIEYIHIPQFLTSLRNFRRLAIELPQAVP